MKLKFFYLANLSGCDLLECFSFLLAAVGKEWPHLCLFQAEFMELAALSAVLWTFAVSLFFYSTSAALRNGEKSLHPFVKRVKRKLIMACLLCYGIPVAFLILISSLKWFGNLGDWCWIDRPIGWIIFFYAWIFLVFLGNIYLMVSHFISICRMKSQLGGRERLSSRDSTASDMESQHNSFIYSTNWQSDIVNNISSRLFILLSLGFCLVWTSALADRIWQLVIGHEVEWLAIAHSITVPLQGFVNCMIYVFVHYFTFPTTRKSVLPAMPKIQMVNS